MLARLLRGEFADRAQTESRFDRVLDELRRDREAQTRKWEEQNRKWEEQTRQWREAKEESDRRWEEQNRKWEEQTRQWREAKEESDRKWEEEKRRWEELSKERKQAWEEQNRKWREAKEESDRKWEEEKRRWEELSKERKQAWEEQNRKWREAKEESDRKWEEEKRRWEELSKERKRAWEKFNRSIGALGARWGIRSERAFRDALAGILEENFGVEVLNINEFDDEGEVFGYPEQVELDIVIKNGTLIICELKSSIDKAGMYAFHRKARFYEKRHNRKADKLIAISPMIDARALAVAQRLGIQTFGDSSEVEAL
ncbi:DUF3782 domain-containing protein [Thermochromatium tepidum ATCC 43061]|uniref:DUF3782 domain-containing protein n=2 Tax=Thermochromatium tepidum TaxID=1050 RepID=A0A6I6EGJ9_THETI|nr:DUF3782 domain-containing protein [Thermochromatium tepidum ATCC 43061]